MSATSNVNTIEQRLGKLLKGKGEIRHPQIQTQTKIQKVAHHLRDRKHFAKHYVPKLASFGPIHHGDPKLQLGERYKKMWASMYIDSTGQTPQTLYNRVLDDYHQNLKNLFDDGILTGAAQQYEKQGFKTVEEKICWMLLVDGCALLKIVERAKLHVPEEMTVKIDQLVLVMGDLLLLENQLPFPLLKLLWRNDDVKHLINTMKEFLGCHNWVTQNDDKIIIETEPTHLLDLHRSIILFEPPPRDPNVQCWTIIISNDTNENMEDIVTFRTIKELKEAGIGLKSTKTRRPRDVFFNYGWIVSELKLPEIVVDETTAATMLNLTAYEMFPDFYNDYGISSYVSFLVSLICHADDVKALRKAKILFNSLGSDEEVSTLFNTIGTDLVQAGMMRYYDVAQKIEKHFKHEKRRTWLAHGYNTYFSNPWAITAFLAAVLGLLLTFMQTWYTIHPPK